MTTRSSSASILGVLAFTLVAAPLLSNAQATAPADASSSNATPAAPETPAAPAAPTAPAAPAAPAMTPAPAAPADTNAAAPAAPAERPSTYTVVPHDSLWTIAHKFGTTVVKLRKLNNLKKGALLHPGQVLQIPPATSDTTTK